MHVIDLVCGRELEAEDAVWTAVFGDDTFYFCSGECRDEFEARPEEYLDQEAVMALEGAEA